MTHFGDRLDAAVAAVENPCLLGLDPHLDLLPEPFAAARDPQRPRRERAAAVEAFCIELLDLAAGRVAAVKPQSAFFELFGADGVQAWENVVRAAHERDLIVIGDVKRSDIASTAAAYATSFLTGLPDASSAERAALCDAITVNPYLGDDTLEPFTDACRRAGGGLYVLVRTSNPGSGAFQAHGEPRLCERVAEVVDGLGSCLRGESGWSSVGAVVGATHGQELADLRRRMPHTPLLLPGYGAQGAGADDIVPAFVGGASPWAGGLVNSSRGIAFAWRRPENNGRSWKDAARDALDAMIQDLRGALAASH